MKVVDSYSSDYLKKILKDVKTIALVGASSNPKRDSFKVMKTLLECNYNVFPVNPKESGNFILDQYCYADLQSINRPVDMVDVFRKSEAVYGLAEEAIKIGSKVFWTQLDIIDEAACHLAEDAGLKVVMNRCPKIELERSY